MRAAYWTALDEADSPAEAEAGLAGPVGSLELQYPSAAACLADDLPALTVHLAYPLRLRKRMRSTNLLERSLGEVRRRTKVIGRLPGETSCLTIACAVMDLVIAGAHGLELTLPEHHAIAATIAARAVPRTDSGWPNLSPPRSPVPSALFQQYPDATGAHPWQDGPGGRRPHRPGQGRGGAPPS